MKLSIVIVNYQSWDYLENCIKSFQLYPPSLSYEIIIVNNDSQHDNFSRFSKNHPEILLIQNKGNYGFSHGCNLGAASAKGDYLLFLNPDTELTENKPIDAMVAYLEDNENIGIVSCRNITPNGVGKEERFLSPWMLFGFIRGLYKFRNKEILKKLYPADGKVWFPGWVTGSVVMIKNTFFNEIGKWNEKRYWMYSEDPDLCYRVNKTGKLIALLLHVSIKHIGGGASGINIQSEIRYKVEDTISKHNYIQENSNGMFAPLIHLMFFIKIQTGLIVYLPFFWATKSKIKTRVLMGCWRYYLQAINRKTWKNIRLDNIQ